MIWPIQSPHLRLALATVEVLEVVCHPTPRQRSCGHYRGIPDLLEHPLQKCGRVLTIPSNRQDRGGKKNEGKKFRVPLLTKQNTAAPIGDIFRPRLCASMARVVGWWVGLIRCRGLLTVQYTIPRKTD